MEPARGPLNLAMVVEAMGKDLMRYDMLAQEALRGVVRESLHMAANDGLPGNHHFYIAFKTTDPGVEISEHLRTNYPEEMTIVLQHQFWGLEVDDHKFSVGLTFNKVPHRLVVPFTAITGFYDPSVQFGLQFGKPGQAGDTVSLKEGQTDLIAAVGGGDHNIAPENAKVVNLDSFRKK